jgi:hypothetical protein
MMTRTFRAREKVLALAGEENFRRTFSSLPSSQKKDKKTAHRSAKIARFSGKRRLLTRGSGEDSAKSRAEEHVRPPNVSGVSQVGDRRMNFEVAKPDRHRAMRFKNCSAFARLRIAMQMIVDVGT